MICSTHKRDSYKYRNYPKIFSANQVTGLYVMETLLVKRLKPDSYPPKNCVICFNESPLEMMKNATLKALFVLKTSKYLT